MALFPGIEIENKYLNESMVKLTNSQAWWVIDEKIEVGNTKLQSTLALSYKNLDDAIAGNVEPLQIFVRKC